MIGWAANGDRIYDFGRLRSIKFGEYHILVDTDRVNRNEMMTAFGITAYGSFATDSDNLVRLCKILDNMLLFHDSIFGTRVKSVSDDAFAVFLPSYDSFFDYMKCSDLESSDCHQLVYEARMAAFKARLSPEEFFKIYPSTGCPYMHCWNEERDDVESTCTLCEGYRSRSRSPRYECSPTQEWPCLDCGINLGKDNPRQFCGKTYCKQI